MIWKPWILVAQCQPTRWTKSLNLSRWLSIAIMFGLIASSTATTVHAQSSEPGPIAKMGQALNPTNWKIPKPAFRMPNFLVPQQDQQRIVQRKDGLMSDVKATASKSWQRTKDTFNPARLNPMNLFAGPSTKPASNNNNNSPGFFSGLFAPRASEPEERVAGVNDFLNLDRPK